MIIKMHAANTKKPLKTNFFRNSVMNHQWQEQASSLPDALQSYCRIAWFFVTFYYEIQYISRKIHVEKKFKKYREGFSLPIFCFMYHLAIFLTWVGPLAMRSWPSSPPSSSSIKASGLSSFFSCICVWSKPLLPRAAPQSKWGVTGTMGFRMNWTAFCPYQVRLPRLALPAFVRPTCQPRWANFTLK